MSKLIQNIKNGRLLKKNGSWMYCNKCNKTVGYLCYTTYLEFKFDFTCNCGNEGSFHLLYPTESDTQQSTSDLKLVKNRLCCPVDDSPLFTIVGKNIKLADYFITCKACLNKFTNNQ